MRLKGSTDLQMIHVIQKVGGSIGDSFLDEGFILEKKIGVGQPKRIENAKILVANTPMDYDKIKIFGAKVNPAFPLSLSLRTCEQTQIIYYMLGLTLLCEYRIARDFFGSFSLAVSFRVATAMRGKRKRHYIHSFPSSSLSPSPSPTPALSHSFTQVEADDPDQVAKIEQAERARMLKKCQKILNHNINCFINRQLIYNIPEQVSLKRRGKSTKK